MKRHLAILFCLLILPGSALADGPGPQRKMTDAESASFGKVRSTIQDALPKVPEGYTFKFEYTRDLDEGMVPESLKPSQMLRMEYMATYTRDQSLDEGQQMSYFMNRAKGTPEQQAKMAELNARHAELMKARDKARDPAEKNRIRAEMKTVNADSDKLLDEIAAGYQAWMASGGPTTAAEDFQKSLPAKELTVRVRINDNVSLSDKATPIAVEGGSPAFEQTGECGGSDDYCITVFVGPFEKVKKNSGYTYFQLADTDLGVPTRARGLALTFTGPKDKPESLRDFVRGTGWASLRGLLP